MKKTAIIALVLGALILAACGQKSGVHLASGRNGALVNPETGEVIGGASGDATGAGESAAAGGGGGGGSGGGGRWRQGGRRHGRCRRQPIGRSRALWYGGRRWWHVGWRRGR